MSTHRKDRLLASLLTSLVEEWGYAEVHRSLLGLERMLDENTDVSAAGGRTREQSEPRRRVSAVEIVNRAEASPARKAHLLAVAAKFDSGSFLPTGSEVRHFLEMRGRQAGRLKRRHDSFRRVLDALVVMSDEELKTLAETDVHAGPTELGPLSNAIKAHGASMRPSDATTSEEPNND